MKTKITKTTKVKSKKTTKAKSKKTTKTKSKKVTKTKSKKTTKAKSKKVTKEMKTTKSVKKELSKKVRKKVNGGGTPTPPRGHDSNPCKYQYELEKCPYKNNAYACTHAFGYECAYRKALGIHF